MRVRTPWLGRYVWLGPLIMLGMIAIGAIMLIMQMTLRPWGGLDSGPDTHLNYNSPDSAYTRSRFAYVGDDEAGLAGWVPSLAAAQSNDPGLGLYVGYGCAGCHGINGGGTPAGPIVAAKSVRRVTTLTRKGPGQMPAYQVKDLDDNALAWIADYVESLSEVPEIEPDVPPPTPTATPWPSPTPLATATSEPSDTSTEDGTGTGATEQPTPTPIPEPTAVPLPPVDPAVLKNARSIYIDLGCDLCHGESAQGTDDGPGLYGLIAEHILDYTRDPSPSPDSEWSKPMDGYTVGELSDDELDQIVLYLLHVKAPDGDTP